MVIMFRSMHFNCMRMLFCLGVLFLGSYAWCMEAGAPKEKKLIYMFVQPWTDDPEVFSVKLSHRPGFYIPGSPKNHDADYAEVRFWTRDGEPVRDDSAKTPSGLCPAIADFLASGVSLPDHISAQTCTIQVFFEHTKDANGQPVLIDDLDCKGDGCYKKTLDRIKALMKLGVVQNFSAKLGARIYELSDEEFQKEKDRLAWGGLNKYRILSFSHKNIDTTDEYTRQQFDTFASQDYTPIPRHDHKVWVEQLKRGKFSLHVDQRARWGVGECIVGAAAFGFCCFVVHTLVNKQQNKTASDTVSLENLDGEWDEELLADETMQKTEGDCMSTPHVLQTLLTQVRKEKWPFPKTFQALKDIGTTSYDFDVASCTGTYYGNFDTWQEKVMPDLVPLAIAPTFEYDLFVERLRIHQQGKTTYSAFIQDCAAAGIVCYRVDMGASTVIYYGAQLGQSYAEHVPAWQG